MPAGSLARRRSWEAGRLLLLVLGSATFVHVLLRTGPGRVVRGPRQLAIGLGAALPAIGTVLFSHGLTFLAWKISPPEIGGVGLGLLLAAAGTPLLIRRFLVLAEDDGKAIRGWHFLGLRFREREESLPVLDRVGLRRATDDFVVFVAGPAASERVEASSSLISARDRARRLASLLAINTWAAAQLGRSLDGNGGVLGWMPIDPRFVPAIERVAGADALAHTVGEALALHLWQTRDFGAQRFPDDFNAWWAQWSRARRLPPAPDERVH
jgi:hypothetical protein